MKPANKPWYLPRSCDDEIETISRATDQVPAKTVRSFERLEGYSPAIRECVQEFGEPIVTACLQAGVREPRRIRELVREIWDGARQTTQKRPLLGALDWLLTQAGAQITTKTLIRVLRDSHYYLVPLDPTSEMVDASMETVSNFDMRVTKRDKHRLRLRAGIRAGIKHLWPDME